MDELPGIPSPKDIMEVTGVDALAKKPHGGKSIEGTAEDFEAMFVSQMLQPMWAGIETDGPFGGGSAEETFRSMMITEYGKLIAKAGGIGISSTVQSELLRMQEKANG